MSRPSLLKLSEELRPYIEGKSTSQRIRGVLVCMDGRKRYESGSVDADQLMRFR